MTSLGGRASRGREPEDKGRVFTGKHKRLTGVLEDLRGTKRDNAERSGQGRVEGGNLGIKAGFLLEFLCGNFI